VLVSCAPAAQAQSFASLFTTLPSDFKHLVSVDSAIAIGGGGALAVPLWSSEHTNGEGSEAFDAGNVIGDGAVQAAGALTVYVLGAANHSSRVQRLGADLVRAQIVNGVMTDGLKLAVDRTRPDGGSHSFPSGHASAAFATATVLQAHLGWKIGIPAYALAAYVGSARVTSNHHYTSDVVFGAGLGIAAGRATTFTVRQQRIAIAPTIGPGRVGVGVTVGAN
jgi:membrane-associated phospholipid phosphatase